MNIFKDWLRRHGYKNKTKGESFLNFVARNTRIVKKIEINNKEDFEIHKIFEQLNQYVLNQKGYPDFIEGKILKLILEESKYKKVNGKIKKIRLACKHDWGNTSYCENCLSVDNCPVK